MTDILDTDQACDYLKIKKPTLYKYVRLGGIPSFKMGRLLRFHKGSLERWIEEKVQDDTSKRANKKRGMRG